MPTPNSGKSPLAKSRMLGNFLGRSRTRVAFLVTATLGIGCAAICLEGFLFQPRQQGQIAMAFATPGPAAALRVSRPRLAWSVWGKGTCQVSSWKMTLNGEEVKATYDPEEKLLSYQPAAPLPPGEYKATASVTVERVLSRDVSWTFSVTPNATVLPPAITAAQNAEGETINALRADASLPPLRLDPSLCASAQAHSHYMAVNRLMTHSEKNHGPDFIGEDPETRAGAFGFAGPIYESVAYANNEPASETIKSIFDAPYHRIGLLQPQALSVGAGVENGFITIDTAFTGSETIVTSPANHQQLSVGAWEANETPNPLSVHGLKSGPRIFVGYPIVVASFNRNAHVLSGKGGVKGPAGDITCLINSPDKDAYLTNALIIIPKPVLTAGTYSAWADLDFDDGSSKHVAWNFSVKSK